MAPVFLLSLLGCIAGPFEGTWLFQADRQTQQGGDCETDDDTRLTGTTNFWVDIYRTGSGELVVLYSQPLVGTASGVDLSATWSQSEQGDDTFTEDTIDIEGRLDGGVMTGNVTQEILSSTGDDSYRCTTRTEFTAERNVSAPSAYPED